MIPKVDIQASTTSFQMIHWDVHCLCHGMASHAPPKLWILSCNILTVSPCDGHHFAISISMGICVADYVNSLRVQISKTREYLSFTNSFG